MKIVFRLVLANLWQHPSRLLLTLLAVIAAACVVIWVVSGYDALLAQFDEFSEECLGRYQLVVVPKNPPKFGKPSDTPIDPSVVEQLRQNPSVAAVDPITQSHVKVTRLKKKQERRVSEHGVIRTSPPGNRDARHSGRAAQRPRFMLSPTLVGTNAVKPPHPMLAGKWIDPTYPERNEAAITAKSAQQLEVKIGDEVSVDIEDSHYLLKIIGLVEEASLSGGGPRGPAPTRGPATSALYVPIALAEKITGRPAQISCINIALNEQTDAKAFRRHWIDRLAKEDWGANATILDPSDVENDLKQGFSAAHLRSQAYAATGISLLAALFIILTTLSMGVHERTRQLAVLRAVALTRCQVAMMIVIESIFMAVIGWLGGLAAGWGLLQIMAKAEPAMFVKSPTLGIWAVSLSALCALGGAMIASILPAWKATRISPLEAMAPRSTARPARLSAIAVAVGLMLVAVNPLLVFIVPMADESRYGIYAALGCTCMAIGFVLLAPLAIWMVEIFFGPLVAGLLGLDRHLLATQLSSNLWRTLGTTVALTLGLGLFVAMQIWGYSMLRPFVPGDWSPDALVCLTSGGLPEEEMGNVQRIEGIRASRCLPVAVEQPKLADDITGSEERISCTRQNTVIMMGVDPQKGIGGPDPLLKLKFVEGNRTDAIRRLDTERGCIVPDHFARETGLGIGDSFKLIPPKLPDKTVEYKIAGVVSLPGWHWSSKFSGVRRRDPRAAAMIFASRENVRRDFDLDKINFIWLDKEEKADLDAIGKALEPIASRHQGKKQPVNQQGTWAFAAKNFGTMVRITTPDMARERINERADGMIWAMCQLPLITLLVTSLGVVNAVLASVRTRRWEMGVLRAVGLTRFGLVRMILAEALLIGLVASLLSLGFGLMAGWCGMGISQYTSFFGGLAPSLVIPWAKISLGLATTLGLCLLAALWPAMTTGRAEPLKLLQAGRSAS